MSANHQPISIDGIAYNQLKIEKKPITPEYVRRDPELVPKANRTVVVNPARTCMPFGAMFAGLGMHRGLPFVQGAQGCTTYVRYTFCRIFQEPASIANASFHEDAAVFGGRKNFIEGMRNLIVRYHPDVVTVVTTCSSEIIGDDMVSFIKAARKRLITELGEEDGSRPKLVLVNTPSFAGSHIVGYDRASRAFLETLAQDHSKPNNRINIIPGMVMPGDVREIKHLLREMGVDAYTLFDISDVFDTPLMPPQTLPYYPEGGTRITEVEDMGNSMATFALCQNEGGLGARYLEQKFEIPAFIGPMPMGVRSTDLFLKRVSEVTGKEISKSLKDERGRLLDFMADTLHHTMMKRVAIFGDPDIATGITRFACELGMEPVAVMSGTKPKTFTADIEGIVAESGAKPLILNGSDLFEFEESLKAMPVPVDVIIGNSKGADIAKELQVPLVRAGLFVYDRVGYHKRPVIGYRGGERLLADLVNAIMDFSYPEERTQQL
ncbi:MAG: nitrogenase component 1 [Eubacteriales bacterium]|nr:nitrogenase component 1 [Eubacteriales bacterium]